VTVRRSQLTGRAAVLLVVMAALVVTLAWPARALVEQRRDVAELRADNTATQQRVADLQREIDRWQDPAYVEAQARARLHFVLPGETPYVVLGPQSTPAQVTPRVVERTLTPWYDGLWQSVQGAATDAG
jgi:cell division protein FtsB